MDSLNCWYPCILLSILLSAMGCGRSTTSTSTSSDNSSNPTDLITLQTEFHDHPEECLAKTISAIRAKLGLDPDRGQQKGAKGIDEIVQTIRAECADLGASISEVAIKELLSDAKSDGQLPGFLMNSDGHMYLLLGAVVTADGQTLYQLVHGSSAIALIPETAISQAKFQKAWRLHPGKQGVSLHVGSGILCVDSLNYNFGHILPNEKVSHTFTLTNMGDTALVIRKPQTSCGCTTTSLMNDIVLKPRETTSIVVELQSTNVVSTRQFVYFNLTEPETNSTRQVLLSLFGSQTIFKSVVPRAIDFGIVRPGFSYSQSVSVIETFFDRFSIKKIDPSGAPLTWNVENLEAGKGLHRYKITFTLNVGDQPTGRQQKIVHVITDSRFSPDILVPVTFEVAPRVFAIPSVLALGEVPVGETREDHIYFMSSIGYPFEVKLKSVPPEATCRLEKKKDYVELIVNTKLLTAGLWQKNIVVNVISPSHDDDVIEIRCSGLGKQPVKIPYTNGGGNSLRSTGRSK